MDFRECEYMVEIAKENNITKAAKNLFISQSALNQQLLKLEKELGTSSRSSTGALKSGTTTSA